MSVVIHMDAADFGRLAKDSMDRAVMKIAPGRFNAGNGGEVNADWDWRSIYWLGHDYAAAILARAFLASRGYEYEVLWDTSRPIDAPQRGWCVLTDYEADGEDGTGAVTHVPMVCTACRAPVARYLYHWTHQHTSECSAWPVKAMVAAGNESSKGE